MQGYKQFLPENGAALDHGTAVVLADFLEENGMSPVGVDTLRNHIQLAYIGVPPGDERWRRYRLAPGLPKIEMDVLDEVLPHVWRSSAPERALCAALRGDVPDAYQEHVPLISYDRETGLPCLRMPSELATGDNNRMATIHTIWPEAEAFKPVELMPSQVEALIVARRHYGQLSRGRLHFNDMRSEPPLGEIITRNAQAAGIPAVELFPGYESTVSAAHLTEARRLYDEVLLPGRHTAFTLQNGKKLPVETVIKSHIEKAKANLEEVFPDFKGTAARAELLFEARELYRELFKGELTVWDEQKNDVVSIDSKIRAYVEQANVAMKDIFPGYKATFKAAHLRLAGELYDEWVRGELETDDGVALLPMDQAIREHMKAAEADLMDTFPEYQQTLEKAKRASRNVSAGISARQ